MNATDAHSGMIAIDAPAKINLALHVCGRRADGYHLLDSLVVFTGIGDRVVVRKNDELKLVIEGPFRKALTNEPDNLVLRAARLLKGFAKFNGGAHIRLEKKLPVASGIGGGSADAAATLRACAKLWGIDSTQIPSAELASKLGADTPVCVFRKPAFMSGIGENVSSAPALPPCWLVLVNPGQPLATKDVFAAMEEFSPPLQRKAFNNLSDVASLVRALKKHKNDLTNAAAGLAPSITSAISGLESSPRCLLARLSGSGPTCYGVFADEQAAHDAAAHISSKKPAWWVVPTPVLNA
jgi:4-diphosphocytidyl-2-C-methyl-D-erythritol kinase